MTGGKTLAQSNSRIPTHENEALSSVTSRFEHIIMDLPLLTTCERYMDVTLSFNGWKCDY